MKSILLMIGLVLVSSCQTSSDIGKFPDHESLALGAINYCKRLYTDKAGKIEGEIGKAFVNIWENDIAVTLSNGGGMGSEKDYEVILSCSMEIDKGFVPYYLGAWPEPIVYYDPEVGVSQEEQNSQHIELVFQKEKDQLMLEIKRIYEPGMEYIFGPKGCGDNDDSCQRQLD